MLKISVKLIGLDLFPGPVAVRSAIEKALRRVQASIILRAERNLSGRFVRIRTGKLRRGMQSSFKRAGNSFVATVRNKVFYGQILEAGSKAHLIPIVVMGPRAGRRRPKTLKFEAGGKTIYARQITHPGSRPRPWFQSAVEDALPDLQAALEDELAAVGVTVTGSRLSRTSAAPARPA